MIGIGELVWDLFPSGPRLGGAPFNTVAHLRRLGVDAAYVSAVGDDELGHRARDDVVRLGVQVSLLQSVDLPTGVVRVQIDSAGNPDYDIVSPAAYEATAPLASSTIEAIGAFDIIVFGTIAQRNEGTLTLTRQLVGAWATALRLYDVNLRHGYWTAALVNDLLCVATLVKLNEAEMAILAREFHVPVSSYEAFSRAAAERFDLRGVCVTRGADGAALLLDGSYAEVSGIPVAVADTVGAGDAFAAGLAAGVISGWPISHVLDLANRLGSLVASRAGAIPDWEPVELGLGASAGRHVLGVHTG